MPVLFCFVLFCFVLFCFVFFAILKFHHYHLYKQHRRPCYDHSCDDPMDNCCGDIHPKNCLNLHKIRNSTISDLSLAQTQMLQQVVHSHRAVHAVGILPLHQAYSSFYGIQYPRCYWNRLQLDLHFHWTHQQGELVHVLCHEFRNKYYSYLPRSNRLKIWLFTKSVVRRKIEQHFLVRITNIVLLPFSIYLRYSNVFCPFGRELYCVAPKCRLNFGGGLP